MPKYKVIYESEERIFGHLVEARDWIEYKSKLIVKDGGKNPVSIKMKFVPPHPFAFNMPEEHSITAENITEAYCKVVKYFDKFGIKFRS